MDIVQSSKSIAPFKSRFFFIIRKDIFSYMALLTLLSWCVPREKTLAHSRILDFGQKAYLECGLALVFACKKCKGQRKMWGWSWVVLVLSVCHSPQWSWPVARSPSEFVVGSLQSVLMHWKFNQPPSSFSGTDVFGSLIHQHLISWLIILESVDGHATTLVDIL